MKDKNPKIIKAKALEPYVVELELEGVGAITVDLANHFERSPLFADLLSNPPRFADMYVDDWGWFIAWSDDTEISSLSLYRMHLYQTEQAMRPADFVAWMKAGDMTLDKAAKELGLSRRMVAYYKSGEQIIPRTVLLATIGWTARAASGGPAPVDAGGRILVKKAKDGTLFFDVVKPSGEIVWSTRSLRTAPDAGMSMHPVEGGGMEIVPVLQ